MSIKQELIGKNEMTIAEFGTGDIGMVEIEEHHFQPGGIKSLLLFEDQPKPLDEWEQIPKLVIDSVNSDDILFSATPIVLRFHRKESISQLIKSLQDIYDQASLRAN